MKWLSMILMVLGLGQSVLAANEYAMVDTTREGTAHLMMATNGQFQPFNAGQLMMMMQMDPYTTSLLQATSMRMMAQNGYYQQISVNRIPILPSYTPVSVSASDRYSDRIENLALRYNKVAEKKDKPAPIASTSQTPANQGLQNAQTSFGEALKSCQPDLTKFAKFVEGGSVLSNWMFLRRRLEFVTPECKAAILNSGGSDLSSNGPVEKRPEEAMSQLAAKGQLDRAFIQRTYGSPTTRTAK